MLFLTTFCLIGYCFAFTRLTRWSIETAPFFVISTLISLLYCFAYFGYLHLGAVILIGLGSGCLLLIPLFVKRDELYQKYLTPGFVILFLFSALFAAVAYHAHLYLWDEFTQWGAHAKYISETHGLWKTNGEVIHAVYPPGAALFYYLYYPFSKYTTGAAYFAQQMLILLPLGVMLKDIPWEKWQRAFLAIAFSVIILILRHVHMGAKITLYLDGVVGIYFGMCLLQSRQSENTVTDFLYFVPVLFALVLLKVKLLAFALLILFFMLLGRSTAKLSKKILMLVLLVAVVLVAIWSWQHYVSFVPLSMTWKLHASLSHVTQTLLSLDFTSAQELTIKAFLSACLKVLPYVIVILGFAFFNRRLLETAENRKRILIDQTILLLGFLGFLVSLLLMYLFAFSNYEAGQLASFSRYVEIYLVGWLMFTYGHMLPALTEASFAWKQKITAGLTGVLLLGLPIFLIASHAVRAQQNKHIRSLWHVQKVIKRIAKEVSEVVPSDAKVFTVWQNSTGLERAILTYELIPRKLNTNASSYGKPYFSGDVWTTDLSPKKFIRRIGDYDYLLLAYTDKNFWRRYGRLFAKGTKSKPFAQYLICMTPEFNGFRKPNCSMKAAAVYLFRIEKKKRRVVLHEIDS